MSDLFVVVVSLRIRPDRVEPFLEAIERQAARSLREEPGCLRFDVLRLDDESPRFVLYEIYATEDAFRVAHRAAPYFAEWRAAVEACLEPGGQENLHGRPILPDLMAEARVR